jgi:hypothetical protein
MPHKRALCRVMLQRQGCSYTGSVQAPVRTVQPFTAEPGPLTRIFCRLQDIDGE